MTESAAPSVDPAAIVGPGEEWIAYQGLDSSGSDTVMLVRPDGTGQHPLVPDLEGLESHPDWAPDGERLAFVRQLSDGHPELWVVDADGANAELLVSCELPCNQVAYPDWSPDGMSIYFSQDADVPPGGGIPQTFSIARVDVADGTVTTVYTRDDGVEAWQGRVSPDGSTIAFAVGSEELGAAIFTAPVSGGPETQVTEWELLAAHPDWTNDSRIVFHTHDLAIYPTLAQAANLFVVDSDGANLEQLTDFTESGQRAAQPRVAPDGSGAMFTHVEGPGMGDRRMAFLEFGQTEPRFLPDVPIFATHPNLRPLPPADGD